MPLPGQYFCRGCMRPIQHVRNEGMCDSCMGKQMTIQRAGNHCDHCNTSAAKTMLYINTQTKKRYCVECRSVFRTALVSKGMDGEQATKIMITDFVLVNDPMKKAKVHRRK